MSRRVLYEIAALAGALFVLRMVMQRLAGAEGLLLASGQPLWGDFLAFWSAGKLALAGQAGAIYDEAAIRALQAAAIPGLAVVIPWMSPPVFLLLAAPLAGLPYSAAAIAFLLVSAAVYFWAAWKLAPDARALLFAAALPAALLHLANVQTGLLVAGLTGLALYWLDKRPLAAGAAVALLAVKPHLAILWPILLLVQGRWRAGAAATGGVVVLLLVSGFAFGFGAYAAFFNNLGAAQNIVDSARTGAHTYASLYANLLALGAPKALAFGLHGLSAAAAIVLGVLVWRRGDALASGAALCAATMLISPYLFYYDATLLGVGALLLARRGLDGAAIAAIALAWSAGALTIAAAAFAPVPVCPLAAWGLLLASARRRGPVPAAATRP